MQTESRTKDEYRRLLTSGVGAPPQLTTAAQVKTVDGYDVTVSLRNRKGAYGCCGNQINWAAMRFSDSNSD